MRAIAFNKDKIKTWNRIANAINGDEEFVAEELTVYSAFLNRNFYMSECIIIPDLLVKPEESIECRNDIGDTMVVTSEDNDSSLIYLKRNGQIMGGKILCKSSTQTEVNGYSSNFDFIEMFLDLEDDPEKKWSVIHPYQSIDHRIMAEMSEVGLIEEFAESLANLMAITNHDYTHAAVSQFYCKTRHLNASSGLIYSSIHGNANFHHQIESHIFNEMKDSKFAVEIAQMARDILDIIDRFIEKSEHADVENMAENMRYIVKQHLSTYIEHDALEHEADLKNNVLALLRSHSFDKDDVVVFGPGEKVYEVSAQAFSLIISDAILTDQKTIIDDPRLEEMLTKSKVAVNQGKGFDINFG